jgi:8-oxo-dGTP diphosphatase
MDALPTIAFNHLKIIETAHSILRRKIRHEPIGFNLLPEQFSLTELQQVYEAILGTGLNKRNFRTKLRQMKLLIETGIKQENVTHKSAILYCFDEKVY